MRFKELYNDAEEDLTDVLEFIDYADEDETMDYDGVMGVPITFLDKHNPEQFKIIKFRKGNDEKDLSINGKYPYFRILIQKR